MTQSPHRSSIRNISDYSPFGVQLDGRTVSSEGYRYGFQGQESDDEVKGEGNSVNYKYRMHDPRIGRFFAVDPLAAQYPHNSPYAFSENVVINAVEFEGLERSYTFNSVTLSSRATAMIKTMSFEEVVAELDGLVGTKFSTSENLEYAQKMLGSEFHGEAGYGLEYGNRAVIANAKSDDKTHFYIRLVIDNGNGTWSTQSYKVHNVKGQIAKLNKRISILDNRIAAIQNENASRESRNESIMDTEVNTTPSNKDFRLRKPKDNAEANMESLSYKGGNFLRVLISEYHISANKEKIQKLEKLKTNLIKEKARVEKRGVMEPVN